MKPEQKFVAVDCNTVEWISGNHHYPNADPNEPELRYRTVIKGGAGMPSVHMTEYLPHHKEPRHRHVDNEVLSIFQGEIEVEGVVHRAPSVIYVSRGTLYGPLQAGPEGAKFFRVGYNDEMLAAPVPVPA